MQQKPIIGFAGMTHLGLNSAVAVAERGFACHCYDANAQLIDELNNSKMPVVEPTLPELWQRNQNQGKLTTSSDVASLAKCDIVYISTDVPTDSAGKSDLTPIETLINKVTQNLNENALLVILCQVPPGFTRSINYPQDKLFYQVETLVFGKAVERAMHPERYMLGCADPSKTLPAKFSQLLSAFECPILPMKYESAELAKISINCCLVASVSVANTLAEVCENIGADWAEIAPALKLDKRIGQYSYLSPGLGIAGGNLERDLTTVLNIAQAKGAEAGVIAAFVHNSKYRKDWALRTLHSKVLRRFPNATIAVLGVAYKANTDSIKNSPAVSLLEQLSAYKVKAFDPAVPASAVDRVVPYVELSESVAAAVQQAQVLVIMTPWEEFKQINVAELATAMVEKIIIDPFQVLKQADCLQQGFEYYTLGVSSRNLGRS